MTTSFGLSEHGGIKIRCDWTVPSELMGVWPGVASTGLARTVHSVRVTVSGKYFHTCRLVTVYFTVRKAACISHKQQSLTLLQPFEQHHKTRWSRRTILVPRLLRDALWFDDRPVTHLRNSTIRNSYRRPVCDRLRQNFRTSALTWLSQCRIILTEYRSRSQRCVFRYARSM